MRLKLQHAVNAAKDGIPSFLEVAKGWGQPAPGRLFASPSALIIKENRR
jgi:hypothetical protein